jgi:phage terminase large subunit-like protein
MVAAELGQPLMPWQRQVADVGLEVDSRGLPCFREIVVTVPRQSGKTTLMLAWSLYRCLAWTRARRQRVVYTAQTGQDARMKLIRDQWPILQASPLAATVKRTLEGAQESAILFKNGSRIDVQATTLGAGHGRTIDMAVIDEAFTDTDNRREQAMLPAMVTRDDAQLIVVSTAGTDSSPYLRAKVDTGRAMAAAGERQGIAYFEWSADEGADPDDEDVWWSCMPALGHTISLEVIRHAWRTNEATPGEFRRAFLNQWTASEERVIPEAVWEAVLGGREPSANLSYAVDVHPDRAWASVGVAGSVGGTPVLSLVDRRQGTGWVTGRLRELTRTVSIDGTGPAASLVPEIEAVGIAVRWTRRSLGRCRPRAGMRGCGRAGRARRT